MVDKLFWDTHIHSDFSHDGKASLQAMANAAKHKNLSGICFTEHLDILNPEDGTSFPLDLDAYLEECHNLSKIHSFVICTGIEFSIHASLALHLQQIADSHEFDFIIGSHHKIQKPNFDANLLDTYELEEQMYENHFLDMLESVKAINSFDVLGHMDYVVRYGPNKNKFYSYHKFSDIIDEILRVLIEKGKGIEINTSGFRYGLRQSHPTEEIIKRYRELGGEIITIGSDGHTPEDIAYDFKMVPNILKNSGFKYYTVFKKRTPEFWKI